MTFICINCKEPLEEENQPTAPTEYTSSTSWCANCLLVRKVERRLAFVERKTVQVKDMIYSIDGELVDVIPGAMIELDELKEEEP